MEAKNIANHLHHHEQQQPKGMETGHNDDPNDTWVCRRCGWTYPNAHPSAKHRRNHKKHCGKIEGFKLIATLNKDLKGGSSDDELSTDEHMPTVNKKMEGEHITDHQQQHEHLVQPAVGMETGHNNDPNDTWVCRRCGWTYPNAHPSAKHRRNHKKHCGKIEGFKLIGTLDKELKGGSSDDDLSADEHMSPENKKMEGEHSTDRQHQHEHLVQQAGSKIHHTKDHRGAYLCHRCRWPYPNLSYPGPKHRRKHRKHCGKIKGFILITPEDRETQGGSSDEVSSDDEHKLIEHVEMEGQRISSHRQEHEQKQPEPADYDNLDSHKDNSAIPQTHAPAPKPDNNSSNLDVSSSEANVIKAGQKVDTSDNATLHSSQIVVTDTKVSNLSSFHESAKEVSEAATGTTIGLGLHGLIVSGTSELPKNSTHQDASGPVEHQDFTVKGQHDYAELKSQNKVDDIVLPMLGESIPSTVQPHPSSDDVGGSSDLQIINEAVKIDPRVSRKQQNIPKDVKISFAKVQDQGKIELDKSATTTHAPIHHTKGINSRKVGIASILSFKEINSDELNANSFSVEEGSASAGKIINELAHMKHQVSNGKTQDVSISEMKEQEIQQDAQITSDCSKGLSIIFSSGADSQKENPQSWTLEPQTDKLTQSSAISVDSSSTDLDFEGSGGVAHHQEANSTMEQGISDKPEVYTESKDSSSINVDSRSCREKEPKNFNINSNKMLAPEKDNTLIVSDLVKQDTLKETEVRFKTIEIISDEENDLQASSKVVTAVQDMNFADGCLIESSKEAKKQKVESSACVVSSTIDHEKNGFDPDFRNEDSTEQKSTLSDMDTFKHEVESSSCIGSNIIDHDKNGLDPDCKKEDFTEKKSTISDMDILKHDDASEIAQEKLNKTPAGELVVDEKSVPPEFHLSECVDCSHEGNTVEQDIPVKVEDHVESTDVSPLICGDTDKSGDVETPASFHCKLSDGMLHLEEDKEKVIEYALFKQEPVEETLSKAVETTSCEKHDTQDSNKVIRDPGISCTDNPPTGNSNTGEKEEVDCCASSSSIIERGINDCSPDCRRQDSIEGNITLSERDMHDDSKVIPVETLPKINTNEAINENSAASESQQLEAMVYTDEKKSTEEQAISFKPGDYIECKNISPSSSVFEIHSDESCLNSNVGNTEDILQPEAYKSMTTGSNLSMHALLDESKVPCSKGIERDIDHKLDLQTSSEHIIPDQRMSLTSSSLVEDSNSRQMQSAECSGFTKVSLIECDLRDGDPGCKIETSIQGNTVLPDVDIDSNITPQQKYSEAPASDPDQESAALESVQQKTRDPNSNLQGDDCTDLKAEIRRQESDCEGNEKGPEFSSIKEIEQLQADRVLVDKSSSTTKASSHQNGSRDNLEDSFRESINDVHGDKSLKNCEPALWEQLLETNVNKSANQETYQSPENAGTSPGNPFIYENKLSSKEEVPQTLAIDGIHGLISEQRENMSSEAESMHSTTNNRAKQDPIINSGNEGSGDMKAIHSKDKISEKSLMVPADLFEAPSFMTLVESGNHSEQQRSHNEIQPKVKESNGDLSADAELSCGTHERFHTPLRSLLAEENIRGTHEHSKPDPLLVFQPQTSSQNKIQAVQASSVKGSDQTGTSSQNETLPLKDINSYSKKLEEKVWNSPARLPSMKVEKQKASKVKSVWTMCLCGCDTK